MIAVDANIWVYYLDARLSEHEAVAPRLRDLLREGTPFASTVIEMEVLHYLSNQVTEPEAAIERFLSFDGLAVADLAERDVRRAGELLVEHPHAGIGGRDASLIASMERRGVEELWTHDEALHRLRERLDWLTVEDPVQ